MLIAPIIYLVTPFTALIQDTTARYAVFLSIMLVKGFVAIVGFPCTIILLTNSASSLRILGTLNGFATTFSGVGRAVGPAAVGAVFSWGVRNGYAIAPWWLLALIATLGAVPTWFIVDGVRPTRSLAVDDGEEDVLLANGEYTADEDEDETAVLEAVDESSGSDSEGTPKKGSTSYGTMSETAKGTTR